MSGLAGSSKNKPGLAGNSKIMSGLAGDSKIMSGVAGSSKNTPGVAGSSKNTPGLAGNSTIMSGLAGDSKIMSGLAGSSKITGLAGGSKITGLAGDSKISLVSTKTLREQIIDMRRTNSRLVSGEEDLKLRAGSSLSLVGSRVVRGEAAIYTPIEGVPRGLEPLAMMESISIQQEVQKEESLMSLVATPIQHNKRYHIFDSKGLRIFLAKEYSGEFEKDCFGSNRPFTITLFNEQGREIVSILRKCNIKLSFWGGRNAGNNIVVRYGPTGELFGYAIQNFNFITPSFKVLDATKKKIMIIKGPKGGSLWNKVVTGEAMFKIFLTPEMANSVQIVMDDDEEYAHEPEGSPQVQKNPKKELVQIGHIHRKFTPQGLSARKNLFSIQFHPLLDPRIRAVIIGVTFAIDFSFFESRRCCSGSCWMATILAAIISILILLGIFTYLGYTRGL